MRFIPTRVHGVLDYLTGGVLMAVPRMLGLETVGLQTRLPMALGAGAIAYSLLTDYELGVAKVIPMRMHLRFDAANGLLLAASPWLFGFEKKARLPYLALGLFEVAAAAASKTEPRSAR